MGIDKGAFEAVRRRPAMEEEGPSEYLEPSLGQLPLERMVHAEENQLDELIVKRHSLYPQYLFSEEVSAKRITPLKRIVLARLEGIDLATIAAHSDELGSRLSSAGSIKTTLNKSLEPSVVQRIEENAEKRIRLSAIQTDPKLRSLVKSICLRTRLKPDKLFKAYPQYKTEGHRKGGMSLQIVLEAYHLALQGWESWKEIFQKIRELPEYKEANPDQETPYTYLRNAVYKYFSDEALQKLNVRRGLAFKPRLSDE